MGLFSQQKIPLRRELKQATFSDSFSSSHDTDFNKKAVLLESTLARAQEREVSMKFEDLLIQMLDLYVEKKLGTSFDIAEILNE